VGYCGIWDVVLPQEQFPYFFPVVDWRRIAILPWPAILPDFTRFLEWPEAGFQKSWAPKWAPLPLEMGRNLGIKGPFFCRKKRVLFCKAFLSGSKTKIGQLLPIAKNIDKNPHVRRMPVDLNSGIPKWYQKGLNHGLSIYIHYNKKKPMSLKTHVV
jgi:hypothetical protein